VAGNSLDSTDYKILKLLQENAKMTNSTLSQQVGLTQTPTLERVKKLETTGVIKSYHARLDYSRVGLFVQAIILISLSRHKSNSFTNFVDSIKEITEVAECYMLTGEFDYMLKVMVKDIPSFERLITQKLSRIEEIANLKTLVILSEEKYSPVAPIEYK
jgi:Lrp/AsnC family transcriptional regulator, leucine-responsive regulatory protein